jgi:hypothetical protein
MVLDDLCDESVQRAAAGGGLLQEVRALIIRVHSSFNRFNLTAKSFDTI